MPSFRLANQYSIGWHTNAGFDSSNQQVFIYRNYCIAFQWIRRVIRFLINIISQLNDRIITMLLYYNSEKKKLNHTLFNRVPHWKIFLNCVSKEKWIINEMKRCYFLVRWQNNEVRTNLKTTVRFHSTVRAVHFFYRCVIYTGRVRVGKTFPFILLFSGLSTTCSLESKFVSTASKWKELPHRMSIVC